ncbi:MAG: hypothetical protein IJZ53_07625 [Tyzzerella sp.]|nr:hypothetical protein [Tyzzerella sp.]
MAFNGYLIKVGDYQIPHKYIKVSSYSPYRTVQDLDSYRDGNGVLHRNTLSHVPNKVEFETVPMLTNTEFGEIMSRIEENYIIPEERKASVTLYIPEKDSYVTQDMYMPDITPTIRDMQNGQIRYESIRLAFIGY